MIQLLDPRPVTAARAAPPPNYSPPVATSDFADFFAKELKSAQAVKFSAHATQRLRDRNISLSPADHAQIEHGLNLAASKGARETLLLTDRFALVASVPNRTVITVVPRSSTEDAVFTNVDTTVVVGSKTAPSTGTAQTGLDPFRGGPYAVE